MLHWVLSDFAEAQDTMEAIDLALEFPYKPVNEVSLEYLHFRIYFSAYLSYGASTYGCWVKFLKYLIKWSLEDLLY